jgi:hypothetical protein
MQVIRHFVIAVTDGCEKNSDDEDQIPRRVYASLTRGRVVLDGFLEQISRHEAGKRDENIVQVDPAQEFIRQDEAYKPINQPVEGDEYCKQGLNAQ